MDARLQAMLDHHEITRVLTEYCHSCDRCDVERIAGVSGQDSWDDHGVHQAPGPEYARIAIPEIRAETRTLSHHLGQSLIDINGDHTGAETYVLEVTLTTTSSRDELYNQLGGRYVDRFERRHGTWKIKDRVTVRDGSVSLKVEDDVFALAQLTSGQRSARDSTSKVLGWMHSGAHSNADAI